MKLRDLLPNKMLVVGFVGPSGTGKSYRAQMVAGEKDIEYIIDDGILVKGNEIVAGHSAKKAPTKIETVKKALFYDEQDKEEIQKALKKYKPQSILILGTSDGMVQKIAKNLDLPPVSEIVRITDVATQKEIEDARNMRVTQGKHVIPVPTFQIKKEFSGYLLDPLQIFKTKGKGKQPYVSEKSIIRPTFSYLGNFTISDNVFKQIIGYVSKNIEGIYKINKLRIDNLDNGVKIYIELTIVYGFNLNKVVDELKEKIIKEINKLTTMNVTYLDINVKNIYVPSKEDIGEVVEKTKEESCQDTLEKQDDISEEDKFKRMDMKNYNRYDINLLEKLKLNIQRKLKS